MKNLKIKQTTKAGGAVGLRDDVSNMPVAKKTDECVCPLSQTVADGCVLKYIETVWIQQSLASPQMNWFVDPLPIEFGIHLFVLLSMDVHGGRRLIGRRPTFSSTSVVLKLPAIFYVTQVEIIKRQTHNTSLETENFFSDIHPLVGYCYFHGRIVFGFFFFFFF